MADLVIQPTRKWLRVQYTLTFLILCTVVFLWSNYGLNDWLLAPALLLYAWPISGSIRRRFTKVTLAGDKLRHETGFMTKTIRTIQMSKVQDVTCSQTLWERLIRVGTVSIETAGETSRLVIANIDSPEQVAEEILDAAGGKASKEK